MVRSLVSTGAVLACSWSMVFGAAQAATLSVPGLQNIDLATNSGEIISPLATNTVVDLGIAESNISTELVFVTAPTPPPQGPSPFPAPKSRLPFKRIPESRLISRRSASVFYGIIAGDANRQSGYVRFVVSRSGHGSALVSVDGTSRRAIRIGVDEAGNLASSPGETSVSGQLVTFSDGSTGFNTVVTDAGQQLPVRVLRAEPPENYAEAVQGKYTLFVENSTDGIMLQGGTTGFGTVRVSKRGGITFTGRLSDGSTFSQGSQLNSAGKWPLYSRAANGAVLSGGISFANLPGSDCSGSPRWERRIGPAVGTIQSATLALRGSLYFQADAFGGVPQWSFDARSSLGSVETSSILKASPANALQLNSTNGDRTRLTLNKANGLLTGSFFRAGSPAPSTAKGVIFQKTNQGFGLTKQSAIRVTAAAAIGTPPWTGKFALNAGSTVSSSNSPNTANTSSNNSNETWVAPAPIQPDGPAVTGGTLSLGNSSSTGSTSTDSATFSFGTSGGFTSTGAGTLVIQSDTTYYDYTGAVLSTGGGYLSTVITPSYTPPPSDSSVSGSTF